MEGPDGLVGRVREKPWVAVAVAGGALLIAAWLGWAIYVASDNGVNEGLGVLIAVPALLVGVILVALPFVGVYLLIRRLSGDSAAADPDASEPEEVETGGSEEDESEEGDQEEPDEGDEEEEEPEEAEANKPG